jgi:hypothetical protein
MIEATSTYEMLVSLYETTRRNNPEDSHLQTRRRENLKSYSYTTGLFQKKYTLSKIYFTKTTDAKSMSCVRIERKSLKVLISIIWSGASLRLWLLLPVTCCDEGGKSWIIDLTSAASHVGLTSSACKVWKKNLRVLPSVYIQHVGTCKIHFSKCILLF